VYAGTRPEKLALSTISVMEPEQGIWRARDTVQAARLQSGTDVPG
jgi:hypothetical protein